MSRSRVFDELRLALEATFGAESNEIEGSKSNSSRLDLKRSRRTGIPEVVYAESKTASEAISSLLRLADTNGRAIASRCPIPTLELLQRELALPYEVSIHELAKVAVVRKNGFEPRPTGGLIGVICAGTSDIPVADEAALMAIEMGCAVERVNDVGVAGLHRLVAPLRRLLDGNPGVDALIVAAGMDGALPSVIAGLVDVPIVGLPISVGYGFGGDGTGALMAMLQSCAPGLSVVNIDNGIGAGAVAARFANRVASLRT